VRRLAFVSFVALVAVVPAAAAVAADAPVPSSTTPPTSSSTSVPPTTTAAPTTTTTAPTPLNTRAPEVAIELMRATRRIEVMDRQLATADARMTSAQAALQQTIQQIADNQRQIEQVKAALRARAVAAYTRGSTSTEAVLDIHSVNDFNVATSYAHAALDVDDSVLADLNHTEDQLEGIRAQQNDQLESARNDAQQLSQQRQQLVTTRDDDQHQLDDWGAVPVMGDTWLTPGQLAGWYRSTGAVPKLAPGTTIDDIAHLYVIEGNEEHVRGDLAFAQAIIETGSFSVAAGNNYSGIGVCDSCTGGYAFPTPLDGIRAQIQLLRNYADPDSRARLLANVPSPALYGANAEKAASTYDSFFLKGKAPLWNQMGNGNWATDPTYAHKVIGLFVQMLAFAAAHPDL
jgi:peptidoglycan hydrolase CwlO-like protein